MARIDDVASVTEGFIMANESVFDVAKSLGVFLADVFALAEETSLDTYTGFGAGALSCLQRRFRRVEDNASESDASESALDVVEQAVPRSVATLNYRVGSVIARPDPDY
jgi:hypothetical protein